MASCSHSLAVLFGFDLSLIPAGMTGNTKYFAGINDWLQEPSASTTTRYHGPQRILNPKEISVTQLLVASQPDLWTPQPLLSRGAGRAGWLSSEQLSSPTRTHGRTSAHSPSANAAMKVAGQADGGAPLSVLSSVLCAWSEARLRGAVSRPWPRCVAALCVASRL